MHLLSLLSFILFFIFTSLSHFSAYQNGASRISRAPAHQPSDMKYAHIQGRPPSAALPKLNSQRAPQAPVQNQYNQRNMDFLNVPDEGMSG